MGTDIHLYVEGRNRYRDEEAEAEAGVKSPDWNLLIHEDASWGERSYTTFSVLAGVRNGVGFAGLKRGDPVVPIREPRGLPEDMSPEMARHAKGADHTESWLTLAEVLAYDWKQGRKNCGVVDQKNFAIFMEKGMPDEWSGDVSGRMVEKITPAQMRERVVRNLSAPLGGTSFYTTVEWTKPLEEECKSFLTWVRGLVAPYGWFRGGKQMTHEEIQAGTEGAEWHEGGPLCHWKHEDLRLVFWFDS